MNSLNGSRNVTKVDPHTLSDSEFQELYEVTQDMWACGLGEFIQCNKCGEIQGKKELFEGLGKEVYENTVAGIMRILDIKDIPCPCCGGDTRFIYGSEHVDNIRDKLLTSDYSRLSLVRNQGKIVGNGLFYLTSLEKIFDFELNDHYSSLGIEGIRDRVMDVLGYIPTKMIAFSTLGFIEKYRNPFHIFEILRLASENLLGIGENTPGIMELDRYNPLHRIFTGSGGVSLEIKSRVNKGLVTNTSKNYDSDLIVFSDSLKSFSENFGKGPRAFLKKLVAS